jgi:hypothetical protein
MTLRPMLYDPIALPQMLDYVRDELVAANIPVFRMGDRLVFVFRWSRSPEQNAALRRDADSLVVEELSDLRLLEYITERVSFVKRSGSNATLVPFAPPHRIAQHFIQSKDRWSFPLLNGVIHAPTLRADASILEQPGYDHQSGLYFDPGGIVYPTINPTPTQADVLEELRVLKEPFLEFPFVTESNFECSSMSVAVSAVLTGLIRRSLQSAPIHGFDSPEAGTGKGLACNCVSVIVTGHRGAAITFGKHNEEFKKLLFSALLANDQVIQIDNITRPLEGDSLNSALTETHLRDRVLGASKNVTVPTSGLFLANGNNLKR